MDNFTLDDNQVDKINELTRRDFSKEELYAFPIVLCDNEIDRDGEQFSVNSLKQLAKLFVGKTGIFDHNPKGENQTARIYSATLMTDNTKKTQSGEDYTYLLGYAYMIRTQKNRDLIKEIDGGIKKEVSVSCAVKEKLCSICGKNQNVKRCSHIKGKSYNGKICTYILNNAFDAYEFSFVAVPAQPKAGVTKKYSTGFKEAPCEEDNEALNKLNELENKLRKQTLGSLLMEMPNVSRNIIQKFCERLSCDELDDVLSDLKKKHGKTKFLDEILFSDKTFDSQNINFKM